MGTTSVKYCETSSTNKVLTCFAALHTKIKEREREISKQSFLFEKLRSSGCSSNYYRLEINDETYKLHNIKNIGNYRMFV